MEQVVIGRYTEGGTGHGFPKFERHNPGDACWCHRISRTK